MVLILFVQVLKKVLKSLKFELKYPGGTLFLNMSRAWLFLIQEVVIIANVKPFHTKKCNE